MLGEAVFVRVANKVDCDGASAFVLLLAIVSLESRPEK